LIGGGRRPTIALARVFNCGEYRDKLAAAGDRLLFQEKLCVFDSLLVPNSLILPL